MSMIKNKMRCIWVLMASAIGISAHAAIQVNALTPNALTPNALSVNALNTNATSVASSPQSAVDPAPLRTALRVLGSKPLVTSHP